MLPTPASAVFKPREFALFVQGQLVGCHGANRGEDKARADAVQHDERIIIHASGAKAMALSVTAMMRMPKTANGFSPKRATILPTKGNSPTRTTPVTTQRDGDFTRARG